MRWRIRGAGTCHGQWPGLGRPCSDPRFSLSPRSLGLTEPQFSHERFCPCAVIVRDTQHETRTCRGVRRVHRCCVAAVNRAVSVGRTPEQCPPLGRGGPSGAQRMWVGSASFSASAKLLSTSGFPLSFQTPVFDKSLPRWLFT